VFLAGSLVAGVVAGRLTRGAKAAQDGSGSGRSVQSRPDVRPMHEGRSEPGRPVSPDGFAYEAPVTSAEPDLDRTGLPNPAASVAGDTTYATGTPGGRA
jgi:hypothetical protein